MLAYSSQFHRYDGFCNCEEEVEYHKHLNRTSEESSESDGRSDTTCEICQIDRVASWPDF